MTRKEITNTITVCDICGMTLYSKIKTIKIMGEIWDLCSQCEEGLCRSLTFLKIVVGLDVGDWEFGAKE